MNRKKGNPIFLLIFLPAVIYGSILINYGFQRMKELGGISEYESVMQEIKSDLWNFSKYWCSSSPTAIFIGLLVFGVAAIYYIESQKNFRAGEEYGTSHWAVIKLLMKRLSDKDEPDNNIILTQNFRLNIDARKTKLNRNVLVIGGSGAGKSFYCAGPNTMQCNTSFILTDPKGELLRNYGELLKSNGYQIKVINLVNMAGSDCFNPFQFIRSEEDVTKLITNIISNTTPKGASKGDPFWEKAESLFLQSIFYYVWMEAKNEAIPMNFNSFMDIVQEADADEETESKLDERMNRLRDKNPMHPAVRTYDKFMSGAGDTLRSIIISAHSRLVYFETKGIKRIFSQNDIDIASIGIGKNGNKKTKTAVFCVIPDSDKSYNFVIGIFYTLVFQELYYQADFKYDGRLPIPVHLIMDEFANIALPDDFCSLLSTMRSREISATIIIQNLAQIKAMFKDTWETVPGNCDTLLYLGGNEQATHKYISEMLGKETIDKRTHGESKGKNGSASTNDDVFGRELMTPAEVRKMKNTHCICLVRGEDPIYDRKYNPFGHPRFKKTALASMPRRIVRRNRFVKRINDVFHTKVKEKRYVPVQGYKHAPAEQDFEILDQDGFEWFKKRKEDGDPIKIYHFSGIEEMEDLLKEDDPVNQEAILEQRKKAFEELEEREMERSELELQKKWDRLPDDFEHIPLEEVLALMELDDAYIETLIEAMEEGVQETAIKEYIAEDIPIEEIQKNIKIHRITVLKNKMEGEKN